ncbi:protein BOLA4, chloroplastic/mitochondrial [Telopea speciosissima]|uniref:protein BOLA4, chloroplastic/mitochondrial n=1 Tax=Telopea speciosissima TaxID=54955 RepID=UPI001CC5920F|nr:protein BOLA4, chloroplastic/mitochondrial [Telopea speciosissima]XP_043695263.1 protein BOLA4, chloroplastic/mitochondrial [Telopea speciosissima]
MATKLLLLPYVLSAFRAPLLCRALPCFRVRPFVSSSAFRCLQGVCGNKLEIRGVSIDGNRFQTVKGRNFCVRATEVNDSGSIDSSMMQSMEKKIKEQLNADAVTVKDAYGDGRHVSIDVISSAFEGESAVNRQRMVYKAIWEELQTTVHAVDQMTTKTPSEATESR